MQGRRARPRRGVSKKTASALMSNIRKPKVSAAPPMSSHRQFANGTSRPRLDGHDVEPTVIREFTEEEIARRARRLKKGESLFSFATEALQGATSALGLPTPHHSDLESMLTQFEKQQEMLSKEIVNIEGGASGAASSDDRPMSSPSLGLLNITTVADIERIEIESPDKEQRKADKAADDALLVKLPFETRREEKGDGAQCLRP